jgi:histidinol dehydrogenase
MMRFIDYTTEAGERAVRELLDGLRLSAREMALPGGRYARETAAVSAILSRVAEGGDEALVGIAREFDDATFEVGQLRVSRQEMAEAAGRTAPELMGALRRSIAQVREYQRHVMPGLVPSLRRPGVELGMRFTPIDSVGLYVPGGKAAYPSSLIMLAVPAQVAGVRRIVVCTPPSKYGRGDLLLAAAHELGLEEVYRAGGAAAIGAMAFGTATIAAVDKICGPGNNYVQLAKRLVSGAVGIDGFAGPSEILTIADETGDVGIIAADLLAQAEHDPGSCFLLTNSRELVERVNREIEVQAARLSRREAIGRALAGLSAVIYHADMARLVGLASEFAAEHVNVQTRDAAEVAGRVRHAGAVFIGPMSAVAAGDYVAGPSHCLPTNTTARFGSGMSVYEFLKRTSLVAYDKQGAMADAAAVRQLAGAETLDGHAASMARRE